MERSAPPADLRIPYGAGEHQFGDLRLPTAPGPHPLAIVIHGGFWRARFDLLHMGHLCAALATKGIATWNIEYRRIGHAGGGWPGTCQDVLLAARYVRELPGEFQPPVVIGYSAGGHLALWLAAQDRSPRGVVSLAGVADLQLAWDMQLSDGVVRDFLGGLPEDFPEASPAHLPIHVPRRLLHGDADENVPIEIARAYAWAKRAKGEDVELIELPGATHYDLIDPESTVWPEVERTILAISRTVTSSSSSVV
ncbi:MAG: prolyl oligopeptidase family serine peptidase [Acidobacteriota bacterium]|nr:prolyl oligopeptidase family serine peptidase [Acidobacteriota bacterium]